MAKSSVFLFNERNMEALNFEYTETVGKPVAFWLRTRALIRMRSCALGQIVKLIKDCEIMARFSNQLFHTKINWSLETKMNDVHRLEWPQFPISSVAGLMWGNMSFRFLVNSDISPVYAWCYRRGHEETWFQFTIDLTISRFLLL